MRFSQAEWRFLGIGFILGALVVWGSSGRRTILVPKGTSLVQVNRFGGGAREIYVSRWDSELESEAEERKFEEHYQREHAGPTPPQLGEAAPLSAEELAKVRFSAAVNNGGRNLSYEIYNETGKTLVSVEVRMEGAHASGVPVGRTIRMTLPEPLAPRCDLTGSVNAGSTVIGDQGTLTVTLVSVSGR